MGKPASIVRLLGEPHGRPSKAKQEQGQSFVRDKHVSGPGNFRKVFASVVRTRRCPIVDHLQAVKSDFPSVLPSAKSPWPDFLDPPQNNSVSCMLGSPPPSVERRENRSSADVYSALVAVSVCQKPV